jgi:nitrite reductase (NADH) small subunit
VSDRWIRIATTDSFPRREGRAVSVGGRELAIFNLGDRFLAVENRCPHQGGPLADGIVSGCAVVCPLHAWKVRLDTGTVDRPAAAEACVHTFTTRVEDGIVMVQLPAVAHSPDGAERAA